MGEDFGPLSALEINGAISGCRECAHICHYQCCRQYQVMEGRQPEAGNSL